jgi:hypothetical protein
MWFTQIMVRAMSRSTNRGICQGTLWASQWILLISLTLSSIPAAAADRPEPTHCELCQGNFGGTIYTKVDQVTKNKVWFCDKCLNFVYDCFECGLPVPPTSMVLSDGRHYCARDAKTALTDPAEIQKAALEASYNLRLALDRYLTFPLDNVDMSVMDRVNIQTMRIAPGADYSCPNLQGLYESITNNAGTKKHSIQILSGLTAGNTRAVIAHELTHAWIKDNVPEDRKLGKDAEEGFCELIAYLLSQQMNDKAAMETIKENGYTRGQFDLFVEAKKRYELQTILDWLKHGKEPSIDAQDIDQVRRVTKPTRTRPKLWVNYAAPTDSTRKPTGPTELQLKGILGNGTRRMAMISGKSFMVGEKGNVLLGATSTGIRCLEIGANFVRVELVGTGEIQKLTLKPE